MSTGQLASFPERPLPLGAIVCYTFQCQTHLIIIDYVLSKDDFYQGHIHAREETLDHPGDKEVTKNTVDISWQHETKERGQYN